MSKTTIEGNKVIITGLRVGVDTPPSKAWHVDGITVHVDCTGATVQQLLGPALGTSLRVTRIQPELRKLGKSVVEAKKAAGPIKLTLKKLLEKKDSVASPMDKMMLLSREEFVREIIKFSQMTEQREDRWITEDEANEIFNRKHQLKPGTRG